MNLSELRELVGNIVDYDPNTTAYNAQVDRLINDTYLGLCAMHPWSWTQKEVQLTAHADVVSDEGIVFVGARSLSTVGDVFERWMEGQIVEIEGVEYTITQVDAGKTAWISPVYAGATDTGVTITIKQRFIDLPEDCVAVLQVGSYEILTGGGDTNRGRFVPLSRYEGDAFALSYRETGVPVAWLMADPASVRAPVVFPPAVGGAATPWTEGVYEYTFGFHYLNRYSAPCPTIGTFTSTGLPIGPRLQFTTTSQGSGYRRVTYIRPPGFGAFRRAVDDISEEAITQFITSTGDEPGSTFEFDPRAPENGGVYQRIRMSPRQSEDITLTIRYIARPPLLLEPGDTPVLPEPDHHALSEACLTEVYAKADQLPQSEVYRRKAILTIAAMEARYLSQRPRRWVKQGWAPGTTFLRPTTTLTHTG